MADTSLQQLLVTNFGLSPSGYTGSQGAVGYTGSAGAGATVPTIASIGYVGNNTATNTAGGETISLTGTGFAVGCSIIINGSPVGVVSFVSSTQVTFTAPALSAGTYIVYLVNSNGSTAIAVPGISYSGVPSFYTAAGSVGAVYEASSFNSNVAAVGDATITYTIVSGSLPTGATLNANGVITGTSVLTGNITTYTFGVNASDGQNQDVTRSYTITVNPDIVTWSTPANGATISLSQNSSSTTTLTAASAAGSSITYTANALPTGLSISGNVVTGTPTIVGNTTTLLTANATSTTRTANITVTWNVVVGNDVYFKYTTLLLSGNGTNLAQNNTFVDSSSNNFAITRNGNATQGTFSPYGANWSNYFDGTGDSLQAPSGACISGTGDFTAECWIYPTVVPGTYNIIGCSDASAGLTMFGLNANGTIFMGRSLIDVQATSSNTVNYNAWNHIAVSRSSGTVKIFVNGVQGYSGSITTSYSSGTVRIGTDGGGSALPYTGYISNYRIIQGSALYTSAFTPSTTPLTAITNTALLTCQSNRFIDNSTNAFTITKNGDVSVQRFSPFSPGASYSASTIGGSGYFNGSSSVVLPTAQTTTGSFTAECWFYRSADPANYHVIFGGENIGSGGAVNTQLTVKTTGVVGFVINAAAGAADSAAGVVPLGQWSHIAWVRSGTTCATFVNGARVATGTSSGTLNIKMIGAGGNGAGGNYGGGYDSIGYIAGARLTTSAVYDPTLTTLTVPTAPPTAIANTQLLCNFTNAGIIDSTMQHNIETVGDAKISTAQSKFGGSSMYFDGTGDYLSVPINSSFTFGTGDFTIESWFYLTAAGNVYPFIYSQARAGTSLDIRFGNNGFGNFLQVAIDSATLSAVWSCNLTQAAAVGSWKHVAFTRSGSTCRLFVDGIQQSLGSGANPGSFPSTSFSDTTNIPIPNATPTIGSGFTGYIDDFRVTKGYARYTANFTPPTALLTQ